MNRKTIIVAVLALAAIGVAVHARRTLVQRAASREKAEVSASPATADGELSIDVDIGEPVLRDE